VTAVLDAAADAVVFRAARQDKPWGHEVIFAAGEAGYVGKVIHVTTGQALSLQYHERNANKAGTLYQDLATIPGTTMRWHLKHRGRAGVDTMRVMVGPPGGTLKQSGANISTGNTAWQQYTGTYTVPAVTRFAFQAVTAGSYGNVIDDIVFTPEGCQ
jgi:hypothetical protein